MITTSIFPGRYVQGDEALGVLAEEVAHHGNKALVLADKFIMEHQRSAIESALSDMNDALLEPFSGECCDDEIQRLVARFSARQCNVVIGVGGGKTLDTAKMVAFEHKCPVVLVPTIASTDAPCSALSVIYNNDGSFCRYQILEHNPNVVLVDTRMITQAPARFLVAGMGDAFATWFEAEDCRIKRGANMTGRVGPMSAYALAHLCHETLLEFGAHAKLACENQVVIPALEHIVEANTLLSGLGFESGGLAAAHAIHNGLTVNPNTHAFYHGEKVAIGLQAMMFLTDRPSAMIDTVFDFCEQIALPVCLADIGIHALSETELMAIAEAACAQGETIHNEPYEVTARRVMDCIKMADAEGTRRKRLQ
ncbi:glycerol dehydrogenase [Ningiella sp. W23]|uniref:glycerol dehydrogenase n=1 Tax=Ningiella sp. W23 TaxID=3023715 RepID=UPI003756493E